MSQRLADAMREQATSVPAYVNFDTVITAAARQRRRRRRISAVLAVVFAVAAALVPLPSAPISESATPGLAEDSLPDRLGAPLWGTDSVKERPLGRASVIFTSEVWWWADNAGEVAVVGAATDEYRLISNDYFGRAGERVLLSPDGSKVALTDEIVDLGSGRRQRLPRIKGVETVTPAAWSRQGNTVAVIGSTHEWVMQPDGEEVETLARAVLALVDLDSGKLTTIAELEPRSVVDGFTVAFAPDGRRFAYQSGDMIVVAEMAGAVLSRFSVPPGTRLAGKGAWTPDGRRLTLVTQHRCCADDRYPSRWRLYVVDSATGKDLASTPILVDPATGQVQPPLVFPEQSNLTALRLLGWSPQGEAVVARYHPEPEEKVVGFETGDKLTSATYVSRADVAVLSPGGEPRVLVTTPADEVQALDVADYLIVSGVVREGHPPTGLGPYTKILIGVVTFLVIAVISLVAVVIWLVRRRLTMMEIQSRTPGPRSST